MRACGITYRHRLLTPANLAAGAVATYSTFLLPVYYLRITVTGRCRQALPPPADIRMLLPTLLLQHARKPAWFVPS